MVLSTLTPTPLDSLFGSSSPASSPEMDLFQGVSGEKADKSSVISAVNPGSSPKTFDSALDHAHQSQSTSSAKAQPQQSKAEKVDHDKDDDSADDSSNSSSQNQKQDDVRSANQKSSTQGAQATRASDHVHSKRGHSSKNHHQKNPSQDMNATDSAQADATLQMLQLVDPTNAAQASANANLPDQIAQLANAQAATSKVPTGDGVQPAKIASSANAASKTANPVLSLLNKIQEQKDPEQIQKAIAEIQNAEGLKPEQSSGVSIANLEVQSTKEILSNLNAKANPNATGDTKSASADQKSASSQDLLQQIADAAGSRDKTDANGFSFMSNQDSGASPQGQQQKSFGDLANALWVQKTLESSGPSTQNLTFVQGTNFEVSSTKTPEINSDPAAQTRTSLVADMKPLISHILQTNEGGEMTLSLRPAHLGTVKVDIQVDGGSVKVNLAAEQASAKNVLQSQISDLKDHLTNAGLKVSDISVSQLSTKQTQDRSNSNFQNQNQNQNSWAQQQQQGGRRQNQNPEARDFGDVSSYFAEGLTRRSA